MLACCFKIHSHFKHTLTQDKSKHFTSRKDDLTTSSSTHRFMNSIYSTVHSEVKMLS